MFWPFALPDGGKLALTGDLAVSGTITATAT
jgi:hypothetical protein